MISRVVLATAALVTFHWTVPFGACGGYAWRVIDDAGYVLNTSPFGEMRPPGVADSAAIAVPLDGRVRVYYLVVFDCDRSDWILSNPVPLALGVLQGRLYGAFADTSGRLWCQRPRPIAGEPGVAWRMRWSAVPVRATLRSIPDPGGCP